jgi:DNA-binding MarR family transcriptional regulator
VIESLAAQGLVVREPHPDDRRSTVLALTPAGRAQASALFAAGDRLMDRLLDGWSAEDRAELQRLLLRFAAALDREAAAPAAAPPVD